MSKYNDLITEGMEIRKSFTDTCMGFVLSVDIPKLEDWLFRCQKRVEQDNMTVESHDLYETIRNSRGRGDNFCDFHLDEILTLLRKEQLPENNYAGLN